MGTKVGLFLTGAAVFASLLLPLAATSSRAPTRRQRLQASLSFQRGESSSFAPRRSSRRRFVLSAKRSSRSPFAAAAAAAAGGGAAASHQHLEGLPLSVAVSPSPLLTSTAVVPSRKDHRCPAAKRRGSVAAVGGRTDAEGIMSGIKSETNDWLWRGSYRISWSLLRQNNRAEENKKGEEKNVLFIHGFGVSSKQFRDNLPALASKGYNVFAIDLIGFGDSSKPQIEYSTNLWADLVNDFIAEVIDGKVYLVGNSIGSLISLVAAESDAAAPTTSSSPSSSGDRRENRISGVILLNCASGMNSKIESNEDMAINPVLFNVAKLVFTILDLVLLSPLGRWLFDSLRGADNIAGILQNVYKNTERVDSNLVQPISQAAEDAGAFEAFVAILTGSPGVRPEKVLPSVDIPVLILWGEEDNITPIDGPVGSAFQDIAQERSDVQFVRLPELGHLPHDDDPDTINKKMISWLEEIHANALR